MENGPHLVVTDPTILDMLYSQNASHFNLFFQEEESFRSLNILLNKTSQFWLDLLNETFSSPRALVLAYPSLKLQNEMIAEENNRVKKRVSIVHASHRCTCTSTPSPPPPWLKWMEGFYHAGDRQVIAWSQAWNSTIKCKALMSWNATSSEDNKKYTINAIWQSSSQPQKRFSTTLLYSYQLYTSYTTNNKYSLIERPVHAPCSIP